MQIAKWGNSLAVRLPASVVKALKLREGDQVDLKPLGDGRLGVRRAKRIDALFEQVRRLRRAGSGSYRFKREDAYR